MNIEQAKKQTETVLEELAAALEQGKSDALRSVLATMARFHRYSVRNALLIHLQRPQATQVAGFWTWKKLGRRVRKGQRGIMILAPIVQRIRENSGKIVEPAHKTVFAFKKTHVFDISQTEGKPLPEFAQMRGDPGVHTNRLKRWLVTQGIEVEYSANLGSADGASTGGKVILRKGLTPAEEFSVLVHELSHEKLHQADAAEKPGRTVRETEAEAVAFVVCRAIGMDTNTASSDYIQIYQGNKDTLRTSLDRIRRTAVEILEVLIPAKGNPTGAHERTQELGPLSSNQPEVRAAAA